LKMEKYYLPSIPKKLLLAIAAKTGTPVFVYSRDEIETRLRAYREALDGTDSLICYAMKANSNMAICGIVKKAGAGADVVSGGELARALGCGFPPDRIIFSGVGKTAAEHEAAIRARILFLNVESIEEAAALEKTAARLKKQCRIAVRINPDIDPHTHEYISTGKRGKKFGVTVREAMTIYKMAAKSRYLKATGIHSHLGSQIRRISAFEKNARFLLWLREEAARHAGADLRYLDIGGGWYCAEGEKPASPAQMLGKVKTILSGSGATLVVEPGRSIVAPSGMLLSSVLYRKRSGDKNFAIIDAAMNDLLRPSLYGARHPVVNLSNGKGPSSTVSLVGPVCESGDFMGVDMRMAVPRQGDVVAVLSAGAYGMSMSSQYNSRPRAAEALVEKSGKWSIIRKRETYEDLIRGERLPGTVK